MIAKRNAVLRRSQIEHDLPHLHRERWYRIALELGERIKQAEGDERDGLQREIDRHYLTRFHPETSRAALLAEAGVEIDE